MKTPTTTHPACIRIALLNSAAADAETLDEARTNAAALLEQPLTDADESWLKALFM